MSSLNKAMIIGRLGAAPDVRYTQSDTAVANMSVATSEKYKNKQGEQVEETEWHRVVVWDKTAENCEKYLGKGSQVYVEGTIKTRKWEDKAGETRYTTEIVGRKVQFLDSKSDGKGGVPHPADQGNQGKKAEPQGQKPMDSNVDLNQSNFDDLDDDLPF